MKPVDHLARPVTGPLKPKWFRPWRMVSAAESAAIRRAHEQLNGVALTQVVYSLGYVQAWKLSGVLVISSLIVAEFRGERHWQYLVSVSDRGGRLMDAARMRAVLTDFGMERAEEDNHEPGYARKFFRLCARDPMDTPICDCKSDESTVVEADGYTWSREVLR